MMYKIYKKDGNKKSKGYCKEHFIEEYGREPNISELSRRGTCYDHHCWRINGLNRRCDGILKLTGRYREDNDGVEEYTCQVCGDVAHLR